MSNKDSGGIKGFSVGFGRGGEQDGPREQSERGPLRVVVLSELGPAEEFATSPAPQPDPIAIDKISFDRVMEQIAPSFQVEVADPFTPSDPPLAIDLRWRELKALRPDAIVEQVPVLRALADAHRIVRDVQGRRLGAADARAQLTRILPRPAWAQMLTGEVADLGPAPAPAPARAPAAAPAPAPAPAAAGKGALDSLLDMVDIGQPAAAAPEPQAEPEPEPVPTGTGPELNEVSSLIAAVARSAKGATRRAAPAVVGNAPQKVERAFARILGDLLQHPEVRRLERAWRGLRFLVDQCDFRSGLEMDVIPVGPDKVDEALRRLADRAAAETSRPPIDLFVVDGVLRGTSADLDRAARWSELAEAFRAPIVTNGDATLLGSDDLVALGKSMRRLSSKDDPRSTAVRGLAARESSRWLAVVLNGFVLRAPYTTQSSRVKGELAFAEDANDVLAHVFGGGAVILAALAARSYVKYGWPTAITGPRDGLLGNLPVRHLTEAGQEFAIPLEAFVTQDALAEINRCGFVALTCAANRDDVIVSKAPVLYRGPTAGARDDAPAASTLADQLFVGRFANAVDQLAAAIPGDSDPKAAAETARLMLMDLFANAPPSGPEVLCKVDPARRVLEVTVRPRRFAGVSMEEVTLGAPLG